MADRVPFISANWPGLCLCAFPFPVFTEPLGDFSATERRNKMKLSTHPHTAHILTLTPAAGDTMGLRAPGRLWAPEVRPAPAALQSLFAPHQQWPSPRRGPAGLTLPSSSTTAWLQVPGGIPGKLGSNAQCPGTMPPGLGQVLGTAHGWYLDVLSPGPH